HGLFTENFFQISLGSHRSFRCSGDGCALFHDADRNQRNRLIGKLHRVFCVNPKGDIMKTTLLAAIAVLSLAFATTVLTAPASASKTYLHAPNENGGGNN